VLSTAHCFSTRNISKIAVILGVNNLNDKLNESNIYYISKLFSHPYFDSKKDYINDIALIKLNKPVIKFNYLVMPICLPQLKNTTSNVSSSLDFDIVDKEVTLIGWGYIDYHSKTLATSLKQMNRKISNNASLCSYIRFNPKTTYCAVNSKKIQDTCNGDSGGPLMLNINNRWFVYGLTSFGDTSCNPTKSSYYSKIVVYLNWINNIIKNN
jgi:secreted trypsin-like serine protease